MTNVTNLSITKSNKVVRIYNLDSSWYVQSPACGSFCSHAVHNV